MRTGSRCARRGSTVVEFALTMPIFLILLVSILEFGWMFFVRFNVVSSVRDGCLWGSVFPPPDPDSGVDHPAISEAVGRINDNLERFNLECSEDETDCSVNVGLSGAAPTEILTCTAEIDYNPIIRLIPMVESINAVSIARMEVQR